MHGLMKGALIVYTNFIIFGLYFSIGYQALLYQTSVKKTVLQLITFTEKMSNFVSN